MGTTAAPAALVSSVRQAWAEALGHDEFSDDENFHRVGGHSGAALRISRILKTELGRPVPMRLLFTNLTVTDQAAALAATPVGAPA
ncbi:acyl carrier protein [Kitasatospora sp. McL0602]|uniref:acyl carrier protein n=1 Tax=Kitasatospora sp. McL0602 TaxID=3439530 RepID=UPI003F88883C